MPGLGIGLAAVTNESFMPMGVSALIEDYMWELASAGNLTPLAKGTVSDFHDTWDIDADDEYMPQTEATVGAEGYWELDGTNIRPLDV